MAESEKGRESMKSISLLIASVGIACVAASTPPASASPLALALARDARELNQDIAHRRAAYVPRPEPTERVNWAVPGGLAALVLGVGLLGELLRRRRDRRARATAATPVAAGTDGGAQLR